MKNIIFKKNEALGDIYMTMEIASLLYREGKTFEIFLDNSVERYALGDSDGDLNVEDEDGNDLDNESFDRLVYKYKEDILVALDQLYDRCILFLIGEVDKILEEEEEQEQLMEIDDMFDELMDKAKQIATKAHEGQLDKAGKPYIEHPLYVSEHVEGKAEKIVAMLHDVIEDSNLVLDIATDFPFMIVKAVYEITRQKGENYADYIIRLRENEIARKVKIEDMKHNMDLSRFDTFTKEDERRVEKYKKYLKILEEDYVNYDIVFDNLDGGDDVRMVDFQIPGYCFHKALEHIGHVSGDKLCKAIEVVNILNRMNAEEYVVLAGLLYCTVEMEKLNAFGIAENIDKKAWETYLYLPWNYEIDIKDKALLIEDFLDSEQPSKEQKQILLATAITELRHFELETYKYGQGRIFLSENEKIEIENYFASYLEGFEEFQHDEIMIEFYWTLQNLFKDAFISYHISKDFSVIYQGCDLYCYKFIKNEHAWEPTPVRSFPEDEFDLITREEAESLVDDWIEELMSSSDKLLS